MMGKGYPANFYKMVNVLNRNDHTSGAQFYRHICTYCLVSGNHLPHTQKTVGVLKEARKEKRVRHHRNAVPVSKTKNANNIQTLNGQVGMCQNKVTDKYPMTT